MQWISVKQRLPKANEWIIYHAPGIFDPKHSAQMWIGQYDPEDNVFFSVRGFFGGGEVTHWMLVPQLPGRHVEEQSLPFNHNPRPTYGKPAPPPMPPKPQK